MTPNQTSDFFLLISPTYTALSPIVTIIRIKNAKSYTVIA